MLKLEARPEPSRLMSFRCDNSTMTLIMSGPLPYL